MLFNSIGFAIFLPVVFLLYWFVARNSLKAQNILLLIASYFFYGCWDWRFLSLLLFSTGLDYFTGAQIFKASSPKKKKYWLTLSIVINLGFLFFFKYYNFFIGSFAQVLGSLGLHPHIWTLKLILPVGISFYTFHGLSYIIDIYRGKVEPENSFINYAVFVSFYPLLVAGPIERATHLLPQLKTGRAFKYNRAVDGLRQVLWGLFKKIVIADSCAVYADMIFDHSGNYQGLSLVAGAVFFAFQIYGDFSGYSDIAIGTARLFGIELYRNFAYPYFSRDIAEFWRRWHISLSTWFRDYLYIPLGGSRGNTLNKIRNTFIIFLVSGFWHGANWTFIFWGMLNAVYFIPLLLSNRHRDHIDIVAAEKIFPSLKELFQLLLTFTLVVTGWIFFRSSSLDNAFGFLGSIFSGPGWPRFIAPSILLLLVVFVLVEWMGRKYPYALANVEWFHARPARWAVYYVILLSIFYFAGGERQFIYFQF